MKTEKSYKIIKHVFSESLHQPDSKNTKLVEKSKLSFSFLRLAISYPKEWKPFFGIFLKKVHIYNP